MQVTVYGATGTFGRRLTAALRAHGHSVIAAHRGIGVDTYSGEGVTEAAEGSEVLVDCVNLMTNSPRRALDFFSRSARSIALAAVENPGAAVVCLSIAFRPEVAASPLLGYYRAKDLQERVHRRLVPSSQLLMFRSTQWFELAEAVALRLGPVALVPRMRVQAIAADEAARIMAEAIDAGERGTLEVAGPEIGDLAAIAAAVFRARRRSDRPAPRRVVPIPLPGPVSREGLIPEAPRLSALDLDTWLASR